MDSLGTKPAAIDPESKPRFRERRSRVRHKVHTPAYASLHGYAPGMPLDLSEILDVNEDGMAVQTCAERTVGENLNLWIDLSETASYLHMAGEVVWSDKSGRTGVRFSDVPEISQSQLREWLFANMIAACANRGSAKPSSGSPSSMPEDDSASSDYTGVLAALVAVKRELETTRRDVTAGLQLIVERALGLTQATGAAIALVPKDDPSSANTAIMICRARAGEDAPDLGARLQAGSGFSGECVRSGVLLRCDDSEIDSRVDRENCRALGIRSMIAVPIRTGTGIVGLLEVFAPQPNAFGLNENTVLRNLAEAAGDLLQPKGEDIPTIVETTALAQPDLDDDIYREPAHPKAAKRFLPWSQILLLILVAITLSLVVVWLLRTQPMVRPNGGNLQGKTQSGSVPIAEAAASPSLRGIQEVRQLAEQGDSSAQFAYGVHYFAGEDVPQDYAEAVRWFSKSAEQNNVMAQATLAACYWAGQGVPRDFSQAYFWAVIAQAGGDEASKSRVALLASRMSRTDVVAAQQQADDWIRQHQLSSKNLSAPADSPK